MAVRLSRIGVTVLALLPALLAVPNIVRGNDSLEYIADFVSGVLGESPITEGFQAACRYLGNSARDDDHHGDFDELQGIANGPEHWYFARNQAATFGVSMVIYRVSYSEHLAHDFKREGRFVRLDDILDEPMQSCSHIGDIEYYAHGGEEYILAAFDNCWREIDACVGVFDASDFDRPGSQLRPLALIDVSEHQGTQASWVCVDPDGRIYSGSGKGKGKENEVYQYTVSWEQLSVGGFLEVDQSHVLAINLLFEDGEPFLAPHWQGADFSSDGRFFYLVNGYGSAQVLEDGVIYHGWGSGNIHVFPVQDEPVWHRSEASDEKAPFRFEVNAEEEPEGCSYFDMRNADNYHPSMPRGELHVILLNNDAGDDNVWIKHYTSVIDVEGDEDLEDVFYNKWGEGVWDGSVLLLESGTYQGPMVLGGKHVLVTTSDGPAVLGEE